MIEILAQLLGFFLTLIGLLFLQRRLHLEIQSLLMLLLGRIEVALAVFSILFLPGVILHELSHLVMAWILRVRTLRISFIPQPMPDGRLRMGYVETRSTDILRDGFIGAAPLLSGGAFIAYTSYVRFDLSTRWYQVIWENPGDWLEMIQRTISQPDFWLWFYLLFVISSTMFPSESDRRAWLPLLFIFGAIIFLLFLAGAGEWLRLQFAAPLLNVLDLQTSLMGVSLLIHGIVLLPVLLFRRVISWLRGADVE